MGDAVDGGDATVVIPAHDEERGIGRLLSRLGGDGHGSLRIVVVANGCSDRTAEVARGHPGVEVLELPEGNKQKAMRAGAELSRDGALVFVDADVVITAADVARLVRVLEEPGVEAAAPRRVLDLVRASWAVRSYYEVWSALPQVVSGLFGRGVIALSPEGRLRIADLPMYLSDDLALSESFSASERRVVQEAEVVVVGPRTVADLVRRRQRIVLGNREFDTSSAGRDRTGVTTLMSLVRGRPLLLMHVPTFVAVTLYTRLVLRFRSEGAPVWLRDTSSREP